MTIEERVIDAAHRVRALCAGEPTIEKLVKLLEDPENKWRPSVIVYSDEGIQDGELARAVPNQPLGGKSFTILVRPVLRNSMDLLPILAHEMCHVILGHWIIGFPGGLEEACHRFAVELLQMPRAEYDQVRQRYRGVY